MYPLKRLSNGPVFKVKQRIAHDHQIEEVGDKLRSMMSWLKK
ncbi:hypothetical protein ACTVJH_10720 [Desulfoplanes sp. PS50]|jgi:ketol-acid reductoisomerase